MSITHIGKNQETSEGIVVDNTYKVSNEDNSITFIGTYTECLTFIGAITIGRSPLTARNFAKGFYR